MWVASCCSGVAAGGKSARTPSGAPKTAETTSQAPGGAIRPGMDPTGNSKGEDHSVALLLVMPACSCSESEITAHTVKQNRIESAV